MNTREKPLGSNDLGSAPPGSDDAAYLAYVEEKICAGQEDVKSGRTFSEADVWKVLGVAD